MAITINIIEVTESILPTIGTVYTATFKISDGVDTYKYTKGGFITGDEATIQAALDADGVALFAAAAANGEIVPADEEAQTGAKGWFAANPNAMLLFDLSVADLDTEITTLIDVSFPLITAGQRAKWRLLLVGLALTVRVLARKLGLV